MGTVTCVHSAGSSSPAKDAVVSTWDVVVIGAGPAGALAARGAALAGLKTLLVENKRFPRDKVCGGYLNSRATSILAEEGLQSVLETKSDSPARELSIVCGHQLARFPLPPAQIICRRTFDAALLESALAAGAAVRADTQATIEPKKDEMCRVVALACGGQREYVAAKTIICADGLSRSSTRQLPEFAASVHPHSRVGIGAVASGNNSAIPANQLLMIVSPHGYVGISRIARNQFNVAAAVDPWLLTESSPNELVRAMLHNARANLPIDLGCAVRRGTPLLTSRPQRVAADRVFLIGDASGYVEPFTGEGIAAALETAIAVTPLAQQSVTGWGNELATRWTELHRRIVVDRQQTCRQLSWVLRRPWAASAAVRGCRLFPGVARRLIAKTSTTSISSSAYTIAST